MKWLALVNLLLHGQQPSLTGVLQRQPICYLLTFILKYRKAVCGSLKKTLIFGIKRHYNRQVKLKLALILEAG
jgi:hypothetical protein